MIAFILGLGSLMFMGGCLHAFIDADEKETKGLYLFATGTTQGNISGGLHAFINVDASDAILNFYSIYPSLPQDLPVYNPDKTKKIADNWQDLMDGSIDMSLADAGILSSGSYWTGADGTNCTW